MLPPAAMTEPDPLPARITLLAQALVIRPDDLASRLALAAALTEVGDGAAAIQLLAEGGTYHAGNPDLALQLGRLLSAQDRAFDACRVLAAGLQARPDHLALRGALAAELAADLQTGAAIRQMRILLLLLPGQSPILANLGLLWQSLGQLEPALASYLRAVRLDPGNVVAQVNLATLLLTKGDYGPGFAGYEHRLQLPDMRLPPAGLRRWQGEDLAGSRLLVTAEQGYGDLLQFIRFVPLLRRRGAAVWLDCPRQMHRLLADLPGVEGLLGPGDALPAIDWTVPLLSLPHWLATGGDLQTAAIPYLTAPPGPRLPDGGARRGRPRIGLLWSGRPAEGEPFIRRSLARRSCRLDDLAPLWRRPDLDWYSLQLGEAAKQLEGKQDRITDLAPLIDDFADSAGLMAQLDLVLSIDTAGAHLAAALGRPLWLMLGPGQVDYRWNGGVGASPWYPSARLFRAGTDGWPALAAQINEALDQAFKA